MPHDKLSYLEVGIFQIGRETVWITCSTAFDSFTYSSSERVIEDFSSGLSCQKMKPINKVIFKNSIVVEQSLKFTVYERNYSLRRFWLMTNGLKESPFFVVYGEVSKKGWKPNSAPLALLGSPYSIYLIVLGFHHDIKFEFIIISWVTEPVQTLEVDYEINYYIINANLGSLPSVWSSKRILIES